MTDTVPPETLQEWRQTGEAVIIDVREPDEYADAHIPGATLLPLGTISAAKLPDHHGKKLVVLCKLGGRSAAACAKLAAENPALQPINLTGGMVAWIKAGYEVA